MKITHRARMLLATLGIALVSGQALANGPKERHEDRKERREERREDRKDKRDEKKDELRAEWKAKHSEWVEKRKARREERREALKKKWGDILERPLVRAELTKHARRVARIERIRFLAEATDKTKVAENAKALLEKEAARHQKRMEALKSEATK